jgi:hypothetical protein
VVTIAPLALVTVIRASARPYSPISSWPFRLLSKNTRTQINPLVGVGMAVLVADGIAVAVLVADGVAVAVLVADGIAVAVLVANGVAVAVPVAEDVTMNIGISSAEPERGEEAGAASARPTLSASETAAGWKGVTANRTPSIKAPRPRVATRLRGSKRRFRRALGKVVSSWIG